MTNNFTSSTCCSPDPRLGLHYFPDTLHYREADLKTWLPELLSAGAAWLVLNSELKRAIPELFLRGVKQAGIQPVIRFQLPLDGVPLMKETRTLLEVYARWGARYIVLFDRPNIRAAWSTTSWAQQDLVERFLDRYLPLANLALSAGMVPIFPPLEPGGSYWDTAFLRSALQVILRRKQEALLNSLVLSAYAWTAGRSLDWGAGGPDTWPQARPYQDIKNGQDHRGFHIFDWYQAIAQDILHRDVPMMLFQAGLPGYPDSLVEGTIQSSRYLSDCKNIAHLVDGEEAPDPLSSQKMLSPLPNQVIACNFWHIGVDSERQACDAKQAEEMGLLHWLQNRRQERILKSQAEGIEGARPDPSIRHYLLLPGTEWGVSDWYLEIIRPFVKKHLPTVGFSADEAIKADQVTVVGNLQNYPEDLLPRLRAAGRKIDVIAGDGTKIASELAER